APGSSSACEGIHKKPWSLFPLSGFRSWFFCLSYGAENLQRQNGLREGRNLPAPEQRRWPPADNLSVSRHGVPPSPAKILDRKYREYPHHLPKPFVLPSPSCPPNAPDCGVR